MAGAEVAEVKEVDELEALLNRGTPSKRTERAAKQEDFQSRAPAPTKHELHMCSVQQAVEELVKWVDNERVVVGCFERWLALGYGPGRRQSAFEAGALSGIVNGMRAHPRVVEVQEKGCLAIANICSGTDEQGLARKAEAFHSGATGVIVAAFEMHPEVAAVQSNGSAALGNICFAGDESGLERKHAAYEAGAIPAVCRGMLAFPDDAAVSENGAFALGNLCRALGKVGNAASTGDASAPELAPITVQLRQRQEGAMRKQAAAEAGALGALVAAMNKHGSNSGMQEWGARALSIITYESAPLREQAKKAGAKMQWLMGISESMEVAKKASVLPASKTGRTPMIPGTGRVEMRAGLTGRV